MPEITTTQTQEAPATRGRRPKTRQRLFFDEFYAMPLDEQAIVLRVLDEHHFVAKREASRKTATAPAPPANIPDQTEFGGREGGDI